MGLYGVIILYQDVTFSRFSSIDEFVLHRKILKMLIEIQVQLPKDMISTVPDRTTYLIIFKVIHSHVYISLNEYYLTYLPGEVPSEFFRMLAYLAKLVKQEPDNVLLRSFYYALRIYGLARVHTKFPSDDVFMSLLQKYYKHFTTSDNWP